MAKPNKGSKVRNRKKTAKLKAKRKAKLRRAHGKSLTPKQRRKLIGKRVVGRSRTRIKHRGGNRSTRKGAPKGRKRVMTARTR
ncbi:MAG: hypothetical protein IT370_25870 [Deltaproteobacteria bacterium]|nr:hypothetical protein [Deltaproteobacteria bacterium]